MTPWLKHEEFVPFAPDKPGTSHIHHCKTGRGNDRLYITRKDDDTILAHCFHCGSRGHYSVVGNGKISRASRASTYKVLGNDSVGSTSSNTDDRTNDVHGDYGKARMGESSLYLRDWPQAAKRWWLECGLTIPEQEAHGVIYNEQDRTIDMPLYTGSLVTGVCSRTLSGGEHTPKYVLHGDRTAHVIAPNRLHSNAPIVIVEDMRSAYKVGRVTGAYPLLGTEIEPSQLVKIWESKCGRALVFLDNDSEVVKRKARQLKQRLEVYLPCDIITVEQDPKNLSEDELRKLLK